MAAFQSIESQGINLESMQPASIDVLEHLISEEQSTSFYGIKLLLKSKMEELERYL